MNDIRDIQMAILKLAKEIHNICVKNNIKYFMLGGTFIGAIRHKGFIPWDDDLDFGMTYQDYLKFIEIARTLKHPWIVFDLPDYNNKNYNNMFVKAYDKNTTLIEHGKSNDIRGVFVDIFPVISAHDNKRRSLRELHYAFLWRHILLRKRYDLYPDRPLLSIATKIVSYIIPRKLIYCICEKQYKRLANGVSKKYYVALDGSSKDVYNERYFQEGYVLYPFEDTEFYGIKDYDSYLTDVFHDYMKLPPESQRKPKHLDYFNPNVPFLEYKADQVL